jgi:hypothetical protein
VELLHACFVGSGGSRLAGLGCLADELRNGPHGRGREHKTQAHFAVGFYRILTVIMLNDRERQINVPLKTASANEFVGKDDRGVHVIHDGRQSRFLWFVRHTLKNSAVLALRL